MASVSVNDGSKIDIERSCPCSLRLVSRGEMVSVKRDANNVEIVLGKMRIEAKSERAM